MVLSAEAVATELKARLPSLKNEKKKLHKLLYFCQGHHLAAFGDPLYREKTSAFDHGPVVAAYWHADKYGEPSPPGRARLDEAQLNTIGYVLSRYGQMSGGDLEKVTHNQTPYQRADARRLPGASATIEDAWIEEYFRSQPVDEGEIVVDGAQLAAWLRDTAEKPETPPRVDDPEALRSRIDALHRSRAATARGGE